MLDIYDKFENEKRAGAKATSPTSPPLSGYELKIKKKKGHYYFALMSGLIWHKAEDIRFLTLTSPPNPVYLPASFHRFMMVLKYEGYRFEYINQRTAEGNGVLHIVAAGDYLPVAWIREVWNRVHGLPSGHEGNIQFKIKLISSDEDKDRLQRYLLMQYLKNQDGFIRYSLSRGWLWPGYRREWLKMVKTSGFIEAKILWNELLERGPQPYQVDLAGGKVRKGKP